MFRYPALVLMMVVVTVATLTMTSRAVTRQDADAEGSSLVGSWIITFPDIPQAPPSLYTFTSDGTVVGSSANGARHGVWTTGTTDAGEFSLTVLGVISDPAVGPPGLLHIWGSLVLGDDQDTFSLLYFVEAIAADGTVAAVEGPFQALGIRIEDQPIEGLGTPEADGTPGIVPIASPVVDGTPVAAA
ncbi:MAG TPA: hypothetical protein VGR16_13045 [Thermomicrobiales bacterium]|nr:hypothetical protein [Thermomicrobiales bacterium]